MRSKSQIKVLHVIGRMDAGGVENWLLDFVQYVDRNHLQMDFLVHSDSAGRYDEQIRSLGCHIISCPHHRSPRRYAAEFKRIIGECGPYDVVHSHVYEFSGFVVRLAKQAGIPVRIVHGHNSLPRRNGFGLRQGYQALMRHWIRRHATHCVGITENAANALFGDGNGQVIHYGLHLDRFLGTENAPMREQLGIPSDATVIGHVGSFNEQKNHCFLVEIARCMDLKMRDIVFLLVGDGPLRESIVRKVRSMDLSDRFIFTGVRDDIAELMAHAMDIFLFPSKWEGLGIVLLEAQAAGLPCVISDCVPNEADAIPDLIRRCSIQAPADQWVKALVEMVPNRRNPSDAAPKVASKFSIDTCAERFRRIYLGLDLGLESSCTKLSAQGEA